VSWDMQQVPQLKLQHYYHMYMPLQVVCAPCIHMGLWCNSAFGFHMQALGSGGIKPCVSSFGGDQFKETSARERCEQHTHTHDWLR
jgi:hypothetical protein